MTDTTTRHGSEIMLQASERTSAWHDFRREAAWCWCLFWCLSAPAAIVLGLSAWKLLVATVASFLLIEGLDALRRMYLGRDALPPRPRRRRETAR